MKLIRSQTDRKLAGVIGGIAESLGVSSTILRILFIVTVIMTAFLPMALIYLLLVFIIPKEQDVVR